MTLAVSPLGAREQAVVTRRDLESRVGEELESATSAVGDVYIGWFAALDAATCPASYHADGAHGWAFPGWSPALAAAAVARAALGHHQHVHHRAGAPSEPPPVPLPDPAGGIRSWMRAAAAGESRPPVAEWITDLMTTRDRATLAATAAAASRWLGGFVRALGWPLPADLGIVTDDRDNPTAFRWQKKHRISGPGRTASGAGTACVTVSGSPDGVLGKVGPDGTHLLVVHRPKAPTDTGLGERAAFEAVAAATSTGLVPAAVLFTLGDTGERSQVDVDAALLAQGVELIGNVVHQRVAAQSIPEEKAFQDATPSATCRFCAHLDRCSAGRAWLDDPTRRDGGLPVLR